MLWSCAVKEGLVIPCLEEKLNIKFNTKEAIEVLRIAEQMQEAEDRINKLNLDYIGPIR